MRIGLAAEIRFFTNTCPFNLWENIPFADLHSATLLGRFGHTSLPTIEMKMHMASLTDGGRGEGSKFFLKQTIMYHERVEEMCERM